MLSQHFATQEKALYSAIVALEEGASLVMRLADQFDAKLADALRSESRERQEQARKIKQILQERLTFQIN